MFVWIKKTLNHEVRVFKRDGHSRQFSVIGQKNAAFISRLNINTAEKCQG